MTFLFWFDSRRKNLDVAAIVTEALRSTKEKDTNNDDTNNPPTKDRSNDYEDFIQKPRSKGGRGKKPVKKSHKGNGKPNRELILTGIASKKFQS